jgi:hypothetical protein
MKLIRLAKGENDFALANLTLENLKLLHKMLRFGKEYGKLPPAGLELLSRMEGLEISEVTSFGESHIEPVLSRLEQMKRAQSQKDAKKKKGDK